jgi:excisionase family DNA binding protein
MTASVPTRYLKTGEAASALRTSADTIRRWVKQGNVAARRVSPRGPMLIGRGALEQGLHEARRQAGQHQEVAS